MNVDLQGSLFKLKNFIEKNNYKGFDPYDALLSPVFKLPFLRSNYTVRILSQQLVKRFPFNLRPVLGIHKGKNPVTLGLCLQGYTDLIKAGIADEKETIGICEELIDELILLSAKKYSGTCWGYDFPWQSKHFKLDKYQPSIVATGIITNGLFQYYLLTKNEKALNLCKSACEFILKDIHHIKKNNNNLCFSYTPYDNYSVFNAAMKGVRLLSQVYSLTGDENLIQPATKVINYIVSMQNEDGSWYYAEGDKGKWIDNYHTGYILDCIADYKKYTGATDYSETYQKGFAYYIDNFIDNDFSPKFYHNKKYPVDCTAAAQTILTLCNNNKIEMATKVAELTIDKMQSAEGSFFFRANEKSINKSSFMRWSDAWMFAALSRLLSVSKELK